MRATLRPEGPNIISRTGRFIYDWLDERYPLSYFLNRLLSDPVPKRFGWLYTFGGAIVLLTVIQIITGIMLLFHYVPSWDEAYNSIQAIDHTILFGNWIRGYHFWNAYMLVFLVGIHMARTYFSSAYKRPRELTWVAGVFLFILMTAVAYTGACLRMDQTGFYTFVVGEHIMGWTPIVGLWFKEMWLGSDRLNPASLTRTFALHVWILPALLLLVIFIHVLFVVLQGQYGSWLNYRKRRREHLADTLTMEGDEFTSYIKVQEEVNSPESRKREVPDDTDYFFPQHSFREGAVAFAFFLLVILLTFTAYPTLDPPANGATTTFVPLPEWFMLPADQMLPYLPSWMIPFLPVIFTVFIIYLILLPFVDRHPAMSIFKRPVALATGVIIAFTIFVLLLLAIYRIENFPTV
jgi:quinol-cytochrome oxidoreductase complex cytochrome b subunit